MINGRGSSVATRSITSDEEASTNHINSNSNNNKENRGTYPVAISTKSIQLRDEGSKSRHSNGKETCHRFVVVYLWIETGENS
jgi:hypothetical protein